MRLLTIILNWRTPAMTLRAAEAALRAMEGIPGTLTIVDNDSGDGSEEALREGARERGWREPRVRILQSGHNGGFGAGNNVGIRAGLPGDVPGVQPSRLRPDLIYILHSDAFPEPGAITALIDHLDRHPKAAFAGSLIQGEDGVPHGTTFRFPSVLGEIEGAARIGPVSRALRRSIVPIPLPERSGPFDWVAGASLMMRMDVLDRIGLFDEEFFLYFEETDLCLRAARAGYETHFVRESVVTHVGSASTGMKEWERVPDYWFDSRLRYFTKNHGAVAASVATLAHLGGGALHRLRMGLTGKRAIDPPGFLRRLAGHHLASIRRPRRARTLETETS